MPKLFWTSTYWLAPEYGAITFNDPGFGLPTAPSNDSVPFVAELAPFKFRRLIVRPEHEPVQSAVERGQRRSDDGPVRLPPPPVPPVPALLPVPAVPVPPPTSQGHGAGKHCEFISLSAPKQPSVPTVNEQTKRMCLFIVSAFRELPPHRSEQAHHVRVSAGDPRVRIGGVRRVAEPVVRVLELHALVRDELRAEDAGATSARRTTGRCRPGCPAARRPRLYPAAPSRSGALKPSQYSGV